VQQQQQRVQQDAVTRPLPDAARDCHGDRVQPVRRLRHRRRRVRCASEDIGAGGGRPAAGLGLLLRLRHGGQPTEDRQEAAQHCQVAIGLRINHNGAMVGVTLKAI
jgi:hypothetical protein